MMEKVITVTSVGSLKRLGLWLCDIVVSFFFSLILCNLAIYPLGKLAINYDSLIEESTTCEHEKLDILYESNFLQFEDNVSKYNFDNSLQYTFDSYLKNFLNDSDDNVIKNYYVDYKKDNAKYLELYTLADEGYDFFEITSSVKLKNDYKSIFSPYFDVRDSLTDAGQEKLEEFKNRIFIALYNEVIKDIQKNDLLVNGKSFNELTSQAVEIGNKLDSFFTISTIGGYVLSVCLYFLLIPLVNKKHFTLAQFFLRNIRVDSQSFKVVSIKRVLEAFVLQIFINMFPIILVPSITIGIEKPFSLPFLVPLAGISLLFNIVSLFFVFFNEYNKSILDILTNSVIISRDDYEGIIFGLDREKHGRE